MSNVASLELSQALAELSGWDDTDKVWHKIWNPLAGTYTWNQNYRRNVAKEDALSAAYDAGYLLRKLPPLVGGTEEYSLVQHKWSESTYHAGYYAFDDMTTLSHLFFEEATTPEDALAKLAIELHKAGILPISGRD